MTEHGETSEGKSLQDLGRKLNKTDKELSIYRPE